MEHINQRVQTWITMATAAIRQGTQAQKLWINFQQLNQPEIDEPHIIDLQEWERVRDQELVDLLVESESFPVLLLQAKKIVQILQFRDWLRECF